MFCTPGFLLTNKKHHGVSGTGNYETLIALCRSCFRICWPWWWNQHTEALSLLSHTVSVAPAFPLNPQREVNPPAFEQLLLLLPQLDSPWCWIQSLDHSYRHEDIQMKLSKSHSTFRWDPSFDGPGLRSAHLQSGFRSEVSIVLRRRL